MIHLILERIYGELPLEIPTWYASDFVYDGSYNNWSDEYREKMFSLIPKYVRSKKDISLMSETEKLTIAAAVERFLHMTQASA